MEKIQKIFEKSLEKKFKKFSKKFQKYSSAENLVLTAAHCCDGMRKGTLVKAGYIQKDEWDNRQTRKMKQYMIHSDYDDFTGTYYIYYFSLGFTGLYSNRMGPPYSGFSEF